VRAVVAGQGIKGGPLFDTTKAWFNFIRLIVAAMKRGYVMPQPPSPDSSEPGDAEHAAVTGSDEETLSW